MAINNMSSENWAALFSSFWICRVRSGQNQTFEPNNILKTMTNFKSIGDIFMFMMNQFAKQS